MCETSLGGVLAPFHAQEKLLASSSWVDQVPNFRQEIRQSNYRNDPVKYDLNILEYKPSPNRFPNTEIFEKNNIDSVLRYVNKDSLQNFIWEPNECDINTFLHGF